MAEGENEAFLEDQATRRFELAGSQIYQAYLDDLCRLGKYDRDFAERASASVLCVFHEQLASANVRDPDSTLPAELRELMLGCARPGEVPGEAFDPETLEFTVAADLDLDVERTEEIIRNVFAAVRRQLTHNQVGYVARKLPAKIQNLWYGHEHAERQLGPTGKPRDR